MMTHDIVSKKFFFRAILIDTREAMLAKARQLGYMEDSGLARRSSAPHTHPWDAAGSAGAPKAKQM